MAGTPSEQEADKVELDEEAKKLKLELIKAEARQKIAQAERDAAGAKFPKSDVTAPEGKTEIGEKVGLVGQVLAYGLLDSAADKVRLAVDAALEKPPRLADAATDKALAKPPARILVVEDRQLVATDWAFQMVSEQLDAEKAALERVDVLLTDGLSAAQQQQPSAQRGIVSLAGPASAIRAAASVAGDVATLVGMFRTDYSVTAREVTIGTTPLVSGVVKRLLESKHAYSVAVDGFSVLDSPLVERFWELRKARAALGERAARLKAEKVDPAQRRIDDRRAESKNVEGELTKAVGDKDGAARAEALSKRVEVLRQEVAAAEAEMAPAKGLADAVQAALERFDQFSTAMTTGTTPPLVAAALRERLHGGGLAYSHVLFLGIEGSGAETITRKSLFRRSGQVGFLGGCEVSFLLLDVESGSVAAAGAVPLLGHLRYDLDTGTPGKFSSDVLKGAR